MWESKPAKSEPETISLDRLNPRSKPSHRARNVTTKKRGDGERHRRLLNKLLACDEIIAQPSRRFLRAILQLSYRNFPGFKIPAGSRARLMVWCNSIDSGETA